MRSVLKSDLHFLSQNFEIQKSREEWESLRKLSSYVARHVFFKDQPVPDATDRNLSLSVLREVSTRTAIMIAGWQAYGCVDRPGVWVARECGELTLLPLHSFMHGVMNTDNIAVNGACIDYGPYAFM